MKFRSLHIIFSVLLIGVLASIIDACKPKKQEIPPFIDVHLDVKDDKNKSIDSATVYIYSSQEAFDQAYANSLNLVYNSTGATLITKIIGGALDLKELPSGQDYWVLVHDNSESFKDASGNSISNYKIDKDNSEAFYKIDGFQNGTIVTANITLVPVSSLVKFNNSANGPTSLIIGDKPPVSISSDYMPVRKGNFGYQARTNACVWTGAVDAVGGQVISEELALCTVRQIVFYTTLNYNSLDGIDIFIGQNKTKPIAKLTVANPRDTIYLDAAAASFFAESYSGTTRKCILDSLISTSLINLDELLLCK